MFIGMPYCSFKCDRECGSQVCQNSELATAPIIEISDENIIKRYLDNDITEAIVFGGLESFDSFDELYTFIAALRKETCDYVVIYTGYNENEVKDYIDKLSKFCNIIVKFGRFIPNSIKRYDEILGVELASDNQYAREIGGKI